MRVARLHQIITISSQLVELF